MPTEYIIEAGWSANFGGLDIENEKYDRAHFGEIEVAPLILEIENETYDRAIAPTVEINSIALGVNATKDWKLVAEAEVLQDVGLSASPGITLATPLTLELSDLVALGGTLAADRLGELNVAQSLGLSLVPSVDKADGFEAVVAQGFGLDLTYLMRSILTLPPEGLITILSSVASDNGEIPLDGAILERGITTILQLDVLGTRLDAYLIEFFVRLDPAGEPILYKSSADSIKIQSVAPIVTASGATQQLTAQLAIAPNDTIGFDSTKVVFFECRMSAEGMGEEYRIAKGKFTITV